MAKQVTTGKDLNFATLNASSASAEQTPLTTYQTKLSVTAPPMGAGTYLLGWYCEIRVVTGGLGARCQARVRINNTSIGEDNEPGANWVSFSGSGTTVLAAGDTPTVDIMYRRQGASADEAGIRRARLYLTPLDDA